jgi:hypothetical protein
MADGVVVVSTKGLDPVETLSSRSVASITKGRGRGVEVQPTGRDQGAFNFTQNKGRYLTLIKLSID